MKLRERFLHDVEATPSQIAEDSHYGWIVSGGRSNVEMAEWSPAFMTVYLIAANVRASLFEDLSQLQRIVGCE